MTQTQMLPQNYNIYKTLP